MLKLKTKNNEGKNFYIVGITDTNIANLKAGKPMEIDLEAIGGEGHIYVFHGVNMEAVHKTMKSVFPTLADLPEHLKGPST